MKDESLLEILEQAVERLGIKLSYEDLLKGEVATYGGMFWLRGERRIIIHKGLRAGEKADLLAEMLSGVDIESIHLPDAAKERIENARERRNKPTAEV